MCRLIGCKRTVFDDVAEALFAPLIPFQGDHPAPFTVDALDDSGRQEVVAVEIRGEFAYLTFGECGDVPDGVADLIGLIECVGEAARLVFFG